MRLYGEDNPNPKYNSWLKAYADHQRYSESPNSFHFWSGVSTIAGALRRRVWCNQLHFQWTPNMYIVFVGPPGVVAKSTSIRPGLSMLEHVEGVCLGPASMTWQALTGVLKKSTQAITISDSAPAVPMSCLTIGIPELGTFLDPKNQELVDFLTDMWDGQLVTWRRSTKVDGNVEIPNPWLNLIACTTPSWLRSNFPEKLVGGGLTSRIVFVYAEKKARLIAYPAEFRKQNINENEYEEETEMLIADLNQISQLCGPYSLTPQAIEWGEGWYKHLFNGGGHHLSSRFDGYQARKQGHVHKLAMILAASRRDELVVTLDDLKEAERRVTDLETDMAKVFESIGVTEKAGQTNEIINIIQRYGKKGITYKELWTICSRTYDLQTIKDSLTVGAESGIIRKEAIPGGDPSRDVTLIFTGKR